MGFLKNLFAKKEYRTVETVEVDEHLRQIMGLVTDTQTALNIPAVSACVDFISNKIAELPIKLYRESDGKTTEITGDFRLSLLNDSTGDLLDPYQMKSALVRDYLLHGAGYIFPERNKNEFVSLRYISAENVTVTKNYDPIYKLARYQIGTRTFFDDEIMRICRNTKDGVTGVGIIQEHADILNAAYKQIVYERYLVERGGNKKGFIQVDDRVTQEVLDDLKEKWQTLYSSDNSNMMVLNKGLKFVESSNTSVEMQLNESKDTNNELICQMFGLSSKVISGTASDEEYISAIKTAVMPIVAAIQTALNKSLLLWAEKSDHYFILDTKELLKGDILKRYQAYQIALHEGFLQVDEVRYEEDREPFNLNWIKLGLQDVLFDTKNHTIYTPNTNQTVKFGEFSIDKQDDSGIIETRYNKNPNWTKGEHGHFTGSTSSGGGFGGVAQPRLYSNGGAGGNSSNNTSTNAPQTARGIAFQQYSQGWQKASLKEKMKLLNNPQASQKAGSDKIIYSSSGTTLTIVYDSKFDYFRIQDTSKKGIMSYMDIDGKPIPQNVKTANGKERGLTKAERRKLTHFLNTD